MTTRRFLAAIATTAVALASCSNGEETSDPPTENIGPTATPEPGDPTSAAPTTTPVATTTSEPTSEPTPTIDEVEAANEDEQAVIDTATRYVEEIQTQVLSSLDADLSILENWTEGQALERLESEINYLRENQLQLEGRQEITAMEVELDGSEALLVACIDASGTDIVDESGESAVAGTDRPPFRVTFTLLEDAERNELGWFISGLESSGASC